MCGIAGIIPRNPRADWYGLCDRFMSALAHRGPDDQGWAALGVDGVLVGREPSSSTISRARAILLHRRLAIIDLSSAGRQPMVTADGRFVISFNGEIYNYLELRAELEALGVRFHSRTDTEVALEAFRMWGKESFNRFVGMFAMAILDAETAELLLARDSFGIKPLYYVTSPEGFAFSSEISPLLEFPGVSKVADPQAVYDFLRYGLTDHSSGTLFAGVQQVPPAHTLKISLAHPESPILEQFWAVPDGEVLDVSFQEATRTVRDLFLESVRLHLRSDVTVAAALSGGIDSSAIVMAMRHVQPNVDIHTFTYAADDPRVNEEPWANIVGSAANATMHKVRPSGDELERDFDHLVRVQEEPFGSTRIYAQYRVFKAVRDAGIKVVLDGQGADELLGGYRYFLAARMASLWRQRALRESWGFAGAVKSNLGVSRLDLVLRSSDYLVPPRFQALPRQLVGRGHFPRWMKQEWFDEREVRPPTLSYTDCDRVLHEALRRTVSGSSLPHLLRYEDRNSMAFSVESRVPFLTPDLATYLMSLPEEFLISEQGVSKFVFREAMRGIVPDQILDRRDKIGFETPQHRWLTQSAHWVERLRAGVGKGGVPFVLPEQIASEWNKLERGDPRTVEKFWLLMSLMEWAERYGVSFQ